LGMHSVRFSPTRLHPASTTVTVSLDIAKRERTGGRAVNVGETVIDRQLSRNSDLTGMSHNARVRGERNDGAPDELRRLRVA